MAAKSNQETHSPTKENGGKDESSSTQRYTGDAKMSAIDRQYATQTNIPRRIHILGTGSIGKLVAHSLRGLPEPPPVTLIFHRYKLLKAWEEGKQEITINDDGHDVSRGGFDVELVRQVRRQHGVEMKDGSPDVYDIQSDSLRPHEAAKMIEQQQKDRAAEQQFSEGEQKSDAGQKYPGDYAVSHEPIHNLIITTKATLTVNALSTVKSRLTKDSTICFLQNGMGTIEEVNSSLFPDPSTRPNYIQGIITHGANVPAQKAEEDPFYAVHAGHGTIALGLLPREGIKNETLNDTEAKDEKDIKEEKWAESSRYLLRTLASSPVLCAVGFTPMELLQQQLEKLAVNSVMNPLTSLLDNRNGSLLYNFALTRTLRLMLAETSHVIRSLPELANVPNVNTRFSTERLETLVVGVTNKTKDNISSMLADVRAGRQTEIEYINGYIVKRGEEIGIKCVVNYAIMQTVIGKAMMVERERQEEVPTESSQKKNIHHGP